MFLVLKPSLYTDEQNAFVSELIEMHYSSEKSTKKYLFGPLREIREILHPLSDAPEHHRVRYSNEQTDNKKDRERQKRRIETEARIEGVAFTVLFFSYVLLFFEGGLADFFDEIATFLPAPWGIWNSLAVASGIGAWIAHRAITGTNWFSSFEDEDPIKSGVSLKAYLKGLALLLAVTNATALGFIVIIGK